MTHEQIKLLELLRQLPEETKMKVLFMTEGILLAAKNDKSA